MKISDILLEEIQQENNLITSDDQTDIIETIHYLNQSYINSTSNFANLFSKELSRDALSDVFAYFNSIQKLSANFLSSILMNDNFYAFSYNKTLLDG